jgi:hypothetical protein
MAGNGIILFCGTLNWYDGPAGPLAQRLVQRTHNLLTASFAAFP